MASINNFCARWKTAISHFTRSPTSTNETELFLDIIAFIRLAIAFFIIAMVVFFPKSSLYDIKTLEPASWRDVSGTNLFIVLLFVSIYLLWTGWLVFLHFKQHKKSQSDGLKRIQIAFDSIFAVGFYLSNFQPQSRLYLLLVVIPIILAGRYYKSFKRLLIYCGYLLLSFLIAVLLMHWAKPQLFFDVSSTFPVYIGSVFYVWFPDSLILIAVAFFTYYYALQKRDIRDSKKILQDISKELVQETKIDELAILFCKKTSEIISPSKHQNSTLHLFNSQSGMLELVASYPTNFNREGSLNFEYGKGVAGAALKNLETINVPNRMNDARFIVKDEGRDYRALLVTPLYVGEKLIGTFSLDSKKEAAFTKGDEEQIELVAGWASVALANAMDFAERQDKYQKVQDLLFYSQRILKPQDGIEKLMRDVIHGAKILLDAKHAAVYLFGVVPYELPPAAVDTKRNMQNILNDPLTQQQLRMFVDSQQEIFQYCASTAPARHRYNYHIPLMASQNRAIGVLSLDCEPGSITSKEDSQTVWLFATQASRELEMALSLAFRQKIEEVVTGFHPPLATANLAQQLKTCFRDIGFQRGFVKVHPFLGETSPGYAGFGIQESEAAQIKQNLSRHFSGAAKQKPGVRIVYVPWKSAWARSYFSFEKSPGRTEQGFFVIRFVNKFRQPIFEIVISISPKVSSDEQGWKKDLKLYVDRIADTIENMRLVSRQASDKAVREEREWLQNDIHDALNVLHGGPLLIGEATQSILKTVLPPEHYQPVSGNGDLQKRQEAITRIENNLTLIIHGTRFVYNNLNRLMTELRQPTLRDKGLNEALLELGRALDLVSIMRVDIPPALEGCLTTEIQYGLYCIGVEAINNAQKHSGILSESQTDCHKLWVILSMAGDTLRYSIKDNGCGFSVEEKKAGITSFGFRQMKRWTKKIGGALTVESTVGIGTEVIVHLACQDSLAGNRRG